MDRLQTREVLKLLLCQWPYMQISNELIEAYYEAFNEFTVEEGMQAVQHTMKFWEEKQPPTSGKIAGWIRDWRKRGASSLPALPEPEPAPAIFWFSVQSERVIGGIFSGMFEHLVAMNKGRGKVMTLISKADEFGVSFVDPSEVEGQPLATCKMFGKVYEVYERLEGPQAERIREAPGPKKAIKIRKRKDLE